jgi:lysophospholipase L1-like esterase
MKAIRTLLCALVASVLWVSTAYAGAIVPANPANSTFGYANLNPANLLHWRTVRSQALNGGGAPKFLILSDSTMVRNGALDTPIQLGSLLNAAGWPTTTDTGMGSNTALFTTTTGWSGTTHIGIGAGWLGNSSTGSAQPLVATPSKQIDKCDIYYVNTGSAASFTWNFDGGSATTISITGGASLMKATVSAAGLGAHVLNINWASGNVYIWDVACYNSANSAIQIHNGANSGWTVADYTYSSPAVWDPIPAIKYLNPDLTIINLTINDAHFATSPSSYLSQLQSIIAAAQNGGGNVILVIGMPSIASYSTTAQQQAIAAQVYAAAGSTIPVIDLSQRFVSQSYSSVLYQGDGIHPTNAGSADMAVAFLRALLF